MIRIEIQRLDTKEKEIGFRVLKIEELDNTVIEIFQFRKVGPKLHWVISEMIGSIVYAIEEYL